MSFTGKATYGAGPGLPELAEDVSDVVGIVSPHETPLLDHLGDARGPAASTVHEWIEDELLPNTDTLNQSTFTPSATTASFLTVEHGARFRVGDLVRPAESGEVMLVVAVTGDSIDVIRAYGDTTAIALANGMPLHILGNAAIEGADAADARFTTRVRKQNYTQIFTATVSVSGSMRAARAHGVVDELDYQRQERLRELLRDLENCVINGVPSAVSPQGTGAIRRSMRGIIPSIETNAFEPGVGAIPDGDGSGSDGLTEDMLNAAMRAVWEQSSGSIDTILVGGAQKRRINSFATATRAYLPEDTRYSDLISVYESDFGVARVVLSRWVPTDAVVLLDSSRIGVMPLEGRSFHYKPLSATGDSDSGQVIGEYTLEMKNENAHAVLRNLAV